MKKPNHVMSAVVLVCFVGCSVGFFMSVSTWSAGWGWLVAAWLYVEFWIAMSVCDWSQDLIFDLQAQLARQAVLIAELRRGLKQAGDDFRAADRSNVAALDALDALRGEAKR